MLQSFSMVIPRDSSYSRLTEVEDESNVRGTIELLLLQLDGVSQIIWLGVR